MLRDVEEHKASLQRQAEEHKASLQRQAEEHKALLLRQAEEHKASLLRQAEKPRDASAKKRPHRKSEENPLSRKIQKELALFLRTQIIKTSHDTPEIHFYNLLKEAFELYRKKELCPDTEAGYVKAHWRTLLQAEHGPIYSAKKASHIAGMAFK